MELKTAVGVCLIALLSATLVVLIARSLDSQAASRLEPQLAKIAKELEAIRSQGGITAASDGEAATQAADDALMVYFFHGVRCVSCRAAEAIAHATLQTEYAEQLEDGKVVWEVLDYVTDPVAKAMAKDFDVITASIVLVKMKDGEMDVWNRLDRVLSLARDKPALSAYLQDEINEMLKTPGREPEPMPPAEIPAIPLPGDETDGPPLPGVQAEIPLPY